jgi:hypothetical protein
MKHTDFIVQSVYNETLWFADVFKIGKLLLSGVKSVLLTVEVQITT